VNGSKTYAEFEPQVARTNLFKKRELPEGFYKEKIWGFRRPDISGAPRDFGGLRVAGNAELFHAGFQRRWFHAENFGSAPASPDAAAGGPQHLGDMVLLH
jgi:hypothetical protein